MNKFKTTVLSRLVIIVASLVKFDINLPECLASITCVSAISKDPKGISVQCGNLIYKKDVDKMKDRVSKVEGKDKDQLKKLYKEKMMEEILNFEKKGRAAQ